MGACMSTAGIEVSEVDKQKHRAAEKSLKEVSALFFHCWARLYLAAGARIVR